MTLLKTWLGTVVGVGLAVLLLILALASSGGDATVKPIVWILIVLLAAGGIAVDVARQKRLKL